MIKSFPEEEKFGLISQMRRAAYSVPMNIIEGAHRLSSREYRQFVGIARGSAGEMKYQLLLVKDLAYVSEDQYSGLLAKYERVSQMLTKTNAETILTFGSVPPHPAFSPLGRGKG
jgi:four helix bundle protein